MKRQTKIETNEQPKRGAPPKKNEEKKASDGLSYSQLKQLRRLAKERGVSVAIIKRQAIDWFLEAIEQGKIIRTANNQLITAEQEVEPDNAI